MPSSLVFPAWLLFFLSFFLERLCFLLSSEFVVLRSLRASLVSVGTVLSDSEVVSVPLVVSTASPSDCIARGT